MRKVLKPLILLLALLGLWQWACMSGLWNEYVLPSPARVGGAVVKMIQSGEIWQDIAVSLTRVLKGYGIAFALAFMLGAVAAAFPGASEYYAPFLEFMRHVPPIALIALLILWFGIGETSKLVIIVLASFFPMFLNIGHGFSSCDPKLTEVARSFGYSKTRLFFRVTLPAAVPSILVGMRIGLGYGWRAIIGAEMFAASTGLGHMIVYAQQMSRSDRVIVGIILIGLTGMLTDKLFSLALRYVTGGKEDYS